MSYNSNKNSKMSKKSMYIKKTMDYDIPQNIVIAISQWVDCYNDNIREKTKIHMHSVFEDSINDTNFATVSIKMSKSGKRSDNERYKYQKEIFEWLASMTDDNVDYYSDKLSDRMHIKKDMIIKNYVDPIRIQNKSNTFDPKYKEKSTIKDIKDIKKTFVKDEYKIDANGKVLYGDAWDLI